MLSVFSQFVLHPIAMLHQEMYMTCLYQILTTCHYKVTAEMTLQRRGSRLFFCGPDLQVALIF